MAFYQGQYHRQQGSILAGLLQNVQSVSRNCSRQGLYPLAPDPMQAKWTAL